MEAIAKLIFYFISFVLLYLLQVQWTKRQIILISLDSDSHGKHEERNNDEGEKQNLKVNTV